MRGITRYLAAHGVAPETGVYPLQQQAWRSACLCGTIQQTIHVNMAHGMVKSQTDPYKSTSAQQQQELHRQLADGWLVGGGLVDNSNNNNNTGTSSLGYMGWLALDDGTLEQTTQSTPDGNPVANKCAYLTSNNPNAYSIANA